MKWLEREYLAPHLGLMVQPWPSREIVERADLHGLTTHPLPCATLHLKGQWAMSQLTCWPLLQLATVFVFVSYLTEVIKYDQRRGLFESQFQATQPMTVGKSQRHELEAAASSMSLLRREKRVFECSSLASSLSSQTLPRKWSFPPLWMWSVESPTDIPRGPSPSRVSIFVSQHCHYS